jgi:hypothetical protein
LTGTLLPAQRRRNSFHHPTGAYDDVFWSIALAVYATTEMQPEPFLTFIPR